MHFCPASCVVWLTFSPRQFLEFVIIVSLASFAMETGSSARELLSKYQCRVYEGEGSINSHDVYEGMWNSSHINPKEENAGREDAFIANNGLTRIT